MTELVVQGKGMVMVRSVWREGVGANVERG